MKHLEQNDEQSRRKLAQIYGELRRQLQNEDNATKSNMVRVKKLTVSSSAIRDVVQRCTDEPIRETVSYVSGHDIVILSSEGDDETYRITKIQQYMSRRGGPKQILPNYIWQGSITSKLISDDRFGQEIDHVINLVRGFYRYIQWLAYSNM